MQLVIKRTFTTAAIRYYTYMGVQGGITKTSRVRSRFFRAALIVIAIGLLTFLETNVSVLNKGLAGTPYLLLVAGAAMWSDYVIGVLAIVACTVGLGYALPPIGFNFTHMGAFALLEFVLAAVLICVSTWQWRAVQRNNLDLAAAAEHLRARIKYLQSIHTGDEKKLAELSRMNDDLEELVDQFLQDEHYWQAQMAHAAEGLKLKNTTQSLRRLHL